jgi:hypothetical protein
MSSLWTPSGEHRVERDEGAGPSGPSAPPPGDPETREEAEAEVEALRARLAGTPAETVVANHCYGLFELGAIYLSADPPLLVEARLAIDAFGLLVEGLGERLGDAAKPLRDALAQIRIGYVQVDRAAQGPGSPTEQPEGGAT